MADLPMKKFQVLLCSETYHDAQNFTYPDHIRNFSHPTPRCRSWQDILLLSSGEVLLAAQG